MRQRLYRRYKDVDPIEEDAKLFFDAYEDIRLRWNNKVSKQLNEDYYDEAAKVVNHDSTLFAEISRKAEVVNAYAKELSELRNRYKTTLSNENSSEFAESGWLLNEIRDVLIDYYDVTLAFNNLRDALDRYTEALGRATGVAK